MRASLALYRVWIRKDQHTGFTVAQGAPATVTVNVPRGNTHGAELEGQLKPASWLTLGGTAAYIHARFGSALTGVNGQLQFFDQVPDAPTVTADLFTEVKIPINGDISILLHGDAYRQSRSFISPRSVNSAGTVIPRYTLADFRFGLVGEEAGWSLIANLKNAFNRTYYVGGLALGEVNQINLLIPGDPRTFTVEARFRF